MGHDDDLLVGHAGDLAPDVRGVQSLDHLDVELDLDTRRPAGRQLFDELPQRVPILVPQREGRRHRSGRIELGRDVAWQSHAHKDCRGTMLLGTLDGAVERRRVPQSATHWHAVDKRDLAPDIAPRKIGRGTQTDVDDLQVEST